LGTTPNPPNIVALLPTIPPPYCHQTKFVKLTQNQNEHKDQSVDISNPFTYARFFVSPHEVEYAINPFIHRPHYKASQGSAQSGISESFPYDKSLPSPLMSFGKLTLQWPNLQNAGSPFTDASIINTSRFSPLVPKESVIKCVICEIRFSRNCDIK
jgi:hypothetical protein